MIKKIIIEKSSLKAWDFSVVIEKYGEPNHYFFFNDVQELIPELEKMKEQDEQPT